MNGIFLILSAGIYFQLGLFLSGYFDENVPKPYMDEIFHIPQAQNYCLGNYNEWDNKITTLPGLYLLSTSFLRLIGIALNKNDILEICNVYYLRLSNVILSTLNFIVLFKIFKLINAKKLSDSKYSTLICLMSAFSMSLFPLNYFFQFVYYTDAGSTLFILLAYYEQLKSNYQYSALWGAVAILFRQTNVVWLAFCLGQVVLLNIESLVSNQDLKLIAKSQKDINSTLTAISQQRSKKHSNIFELLVKTPNEIISNKEFAVFKLLNKIYREDLLGKKLLYPDLLKALDMRMIQPYTTIILTFLIFVCFNNGIVVGDRSNHQASFHLVQLFYFWSFCCVFSFSSFVFSFKKMKNLFNFLTKNIKLVVGVILPLFCVIIANFTYEHPFLLADNRHYTFYIWSKLFRRHDLIKFALSPIYLACAYIFYRNLTMTGKSFGWLLCYSICLFVGLVPQKLIEFRYFIIPFYVYRLNINELCWKRILLEIVFYVLVNFLTIYLFFNKTFYWPNNPGEIQRFMW